jgi:hypothetical protein
VIRAAAGVYYSELPWLVFQMPLIISPPFGGGGTFANAQTDPLPTYVLGANIFPLAPAASVTPSYAANLPSGTQAAALDPGLRATAVSQWNVSLQKSLGRSDFFELNYVGSRGSRLLYYTDLSQCRPAEDLFCSSAAKPWPQYNLLIWFDSSGNSSYHGLISRYQHRMENGVDLRFEYTFAKALTDAWQSSQSSANQIAACRRCDYGPATFDVRHRAVASVLWELPFGRGRHYGDQLPRAVDVAVGGWTFTAIATFASGQPVYLTGPIQTGQTFGTPLPNRVCDGRSDRLRENLRTNGFLWFDTACFLCPRQDISGTAGERS